MCLFNRRVAAPAAASYAPERGEPHDEWWALGERTQKSAEILASILADHVVPELAALDSLETQRAVIDGPRHKIRVLSPGWKTRYSNRNPVLRTRVTSGWIGACHSPYPCAVIGPTSNASPSPITCALAPEPSGSAATPRLVQIGRLGLVCRRAAIREGRK